MYHSLHNVARIISCLLLHYASLRWPLHWIAMTRSLRQAPFLHCRCSHFILAMRWLMHPPPASGCVPSLTPAHDYWRTPGRVSPFHCSCSLCLHPSWPLLICIRLLLGRGDTFVLSLNCACLPLCVCVCVCLFVCFFVCIYVCMWCLLCIGHFLRGGLGQRQSLLRNLARTWSPRLRLFVSGAEWVCARLSIHLYLPSSLLSLGLGGDDD